MEAEERADGRASVRRQGAAAKRHRPWVAGFGIGLAFLVVALVRWAWPDTVTIGLAAPGTYYSGRSADVRPLLDCLSDGVIGINTPDETLVRPQGPFYGWPPIPGAQTAGRYPAPVTTRGSLVVTKGWGLRTYSYAFVADDGTTTALVPTNKFIGCSREGELP